MFGRFEKFWSSINMVSIFLGSMQRRVSIVFLPLFLYLLFAIGFVSYCYSDYQLRRVGLLYAKGELVFMSTVPNAKRRFCPHLKFFYGSATDLCFPSLSACLPPPKLNSSCLWLSTSQNNQFI
ncbi:hypothetical protein RchiOBHm_Chr5g0081751 [Rosa chinensis]|uniref:Uncharacterized protein n=1 Tax=Rosa chinensis TaxID=74649 RepID=A0A2P6QN43_ROSCH|nr:hypothetical protein RchiOBHm_Chr5g0081751 [Rosa chinensis]